MNKFFLFLLLSLTMSVASCSDDDSSDDVTPNNPKDVSVTSSADVLSYNSVVLKGYANGANGKVGFCYSVTNEDPTPETCTYVETSSIKSDNFYELTVEDLRPATKYYYRAYATNDQMIVLEKEVKTFTTEEFKRAAVDLGLSVKWANCNVGATAPEEYGNYYAWGETKAYGEEDTSNAMNYSYCSTYTKTSYKWSTYKYFYGSSQVTKYCTLSNYGTVVDNKTVLESADDAATVNWGNSWRMPTEAEQDELRNKCTWTWTTQNGVKGYKVMGKNGNSIFLPAAGYRDGSSLNDAGSEGSYWSSLLASSYPYSANFLSFDSDGVYSNGYYRCGGRSVRPVCQ